ncbi:hypothetical protein SteCoe_21049 [Stentor coeruleus]|uniref:Ubiquitin-like domain-containing protein n=1 Tax=Stentor coeruleus TaxID=5963 RepID=A0A1R2BQG5_9CILI|nr:hypothetical protein SteCoe_21049 [Stentor coeruleus]
MEIRIQPSEYFMSDPFTITVPYTDTLENMLYAITLTLSNHQVQEMDLFYKGRKLGPMNAKLNTFGLSHGETVELKKAKSYCCVLI